MAFVDNCPTTLHEIEMASKRLGCKYDQYGNNQYICVPNVEKTSLVELCYDGIMGIQQKGYCIAAAGNTLITNSCENFSMGCPQEHYRSSEFFKYPQCQAINTQHQCYFMDPFCPPQVHNQDTSDQDTSNQNTSDQKKSATIILLIVVFVMIFFYVLLTWILCKLQKLTKACKQGYFGTFCNTTCPPGNFGTKCGGRCHPKCSIEYCDPVEGCQFIKKTVSNKSLPGPKENYNYWDSARHA